MNLKNPFEIISPEDLKPEEIKSLFVKSYTELNTLKNKKHTIIYGSRGNGKSMLLRFLEPKCQILDSDLSTEKYLSSYNAFVGIYIPLKEGYFNKKDLLLIDRQIAYTLSKHLINLHIVGCLIDIFIKQLPDIIPPNVEKKLTKRIVTLLDNKKIHHNKSVNFVSLKDILLKEVSLVSEFISLRNFPTCTKEYNGNVSDYQTFVKPFFAEIGDIICPLKNVSFYLLFDEGDRLHKFQMEYINTMIANRDHKFISIKLASKIGSYHYYTDSNTLIKEIHDYDTIVLDELYTHSNYTYFNKVKEIVNRRLESHGFSVNIEDFLPPSESERKLFEKICINTGKEWDKLPKGLKPIEKQNYINKYATARLFQHLADKKAKKRYSGFANIVHFSSGILRNFLHPCYNMYNKAQEDGRDFKIKLFIPEPIQNDIIYKYSDDFFEEIDRSLKGLGHNSIENKDKLEKMKLLLEGLGELFYKRLTDKNSRDPRIISFALKDIPDGKLQEILNYGITESFLHKTYTVSKSGGGRLDCYVLNRALCPLFKLDLSSLRGRILLSSNELWELIKNPKKAVKSILGEDKSVASPGQKQLFNINYMDEESSYV